MSLNNLSPDKGSKKVGRRLGRGHTRGKTCGRGHKGQKSRSGGSIPRNFEGGQMPIQMRLPKTGFVAKKSLSHQEVTLYQLNSAIKKQEGKIEIINMDFLHSANVIKKSTKTVKIILSGELSGPVTIQNLPVTKGVKLYIEKLGGKIEEKETSE